MAKTAVFIMAVLACSGLCHASGAGTCNTTAIHIKNPLDKDEIKELKEQLSIFTGQPCQQETAQNAKQQLSALGRYRHIECFVTPKDPSQLTCHLERFPTVKRVRFEGLPLSVSAKNITRRLTSTAGQLWRNNPRIIKQLKQQVQQLLRRNGYESASVHTAIQPQANNSTVDVVMHVNAGHHTRVRRVFVQGETPIKPGQVQHMFRNMCRSLSGLWSAFSGATFACYSKEKERRTLQKLRNKLDRLGYIQAVIHTEVTTPPMQQQSQSIGCLVRDKKNQKTIGRCVDVRVAIHQGPRVVPKIILSQGQSLRLNKVGRFFRSLFAVEFLSRNLGRSLAGGTWPSDQTILMHQLQQSLTFQQNRIINQQEAQRSAIAMKEVLNKRGFLHANVAALPIVRTPEEIHVGFVVDPGIPTPVTQIRIVGSPYPISSKKLARKAKLQIRTRGGLHNGHITMSMRQQDTQRVQAYYQNHGYPSARVHSWVQMTNTHQAILFYKVNPGKMHRVKHLHIVGSKNYLVKESLKYIANCKLLNTKHLKTKQMDSQANQACSGSFYLPHKLKADEEHIVRVHRDNGYENITVETQVDDANPDAINLSFFVKQKNGDSIQRTHLKNIFVEGNQKTNKKVLLRHIGLTQVDKAKPKDLDKGVALLWQSGLFSRVETRQIPITTEPNSSHVLLQVIEKPSITWDLALALSTDNLFMTEGILKESNLFGSMIQWEGSLGWGFFWGRLSTLKNRFLWPRIGGSPLDLRLDIPDIFYEDYAHLRERHLRIDFRSILTWKLSANMDLSLSYTQRFDQWQKDNKYDPLPFAADPATAIRTLDGLLLVTKESMKTRGILEPSYGYIYLDDPINPHAGTRLRLALEYSGRLFGSRPEFWIGKTQVAGYIPAGRSTFVLQTVIHRAFIADPFVHWKVLEEESGTGPLGGDRQVRGYAKDGINVDTLDRKFEKRASPWEGAWRLQGNAEVRFLLAKQLLFGDLHAALFNDVGFLTLCTGMWSCGVPNEPDTQGKSFQKFGWGLGVGLRHLLPIGPLTLDFAMAPLEKAQGLFGRQWRIHFSFGYPI